MVITFRVSLAAALLAMAVGHAHAAWVAERVSRPAGAVTLTAVYVFGPEDFLVAGQDAAGPFIAHHAPDGWTDEATPSAQLVGDFYAMGDALYALHADADGKFAAFLRADAGWVDVDLTSGAPGPLGSGFYVSEDVLWVNVFVDGGDVPHRLGPSGLEDLCLGSFAPHLATSGGSTFGISGLGYFYRYTPGACDLRGVPGSDWELVDNERLPVGISAENVRFIRGEYHVPQDRAVYTRSLAGGGWSRFDVDIDRAILIIAGPDADVYIGSRAGVLVDGGDRVTTEAVDDADPNFLVGGAAWADDGTVVVIGAGHVLRRQLTPPPPDEVKIAAALVGISFTELTEIYAADGAFRLTIENSGAPIAALQLHMTTTPAADIPYVDWPGGSATPSCTATSVGVEDCTLTSASAPLLTKGGTLTLEVPFTLRSDQQYLAGTVALALLATATAAESSETGTAEANGLNVLGDPDTKNGKADLAVASCGFDASGADAGSLYTASS